MHSTANTATLAGLDTDEKSMYLTSRLINLLVRYVA